MLRKKKVCSNLLVCVSFQNIYHNVFSIVPGPAIYEHFMFVHLMAMFYAVESFRRLVRQVSYFINIMDIYS